MTWSYHFIYVRYVYWEGYDYTVAQEYIFLETAYFLSILANYIAMFATIGFEHWFYGFILKLLL